jgi:hypothetical protein
MCYTWLTEAAVERKGGTIKHGPLTGISISIMKRTGIYITKRTRPYCTRSVESKQHSQDVSATLFHTTDVLFYLRALETIRLG